MGAGSGENKEKAAGQSVARGASQGPGGRRFGGRAGVGGTVCGGGQGAAGAVCLGRDVRGTRCAGVGGPRRSSSRLPGAAPGEAVRVLVPRGGVSG